MSVRSVLREILTEHGELTPRLLVELASDENHPLHNKFHWDDTAAAHKWRLTQAGQLIRSVKVTVDRGEAAPPLKVRAFVSGADLDGRSSYVTVEEVIESDIMRSQWFRSLKREWEALKRRAGDSQEFADMVLADLRRDSA